MAWEATLMTVKLTYAQLLDRAKIEARQARVNDDQANRDYFNHSEYGRLHLIKDMKAYSATGKELKAIAIFTGAELRKCQIRVARLERLVAEGRDRITDLEAGTATRRAA